MRGRWPNPGNDPDCPESTRSRVTAVGYNARIRIPGNAIVSHTTKSISRPSIAVSAWLALGDALVFIVFAVVGRATHEMPLGAAPVETILSVIAPFAAPWFAIAMPARALYIDVKASVRRSLLRAGVILLCAGTIGLVIRAALLQRPIAVAFALVTLGVNGALLLAWRMALALLLRRNERAR